MIFKETESIFWFVILSVIFPVIVVAGCNFNTIVCPSPPMVKLLENGRKLGEAESAKTWKS